MGERLLVAKTDPITFTTQHIGWYGVQVNANDVAAMGAQPRWFMVTTLLPEGASEGLAEEILRQVLAACQDLGVALVGGHSEVTYGLGRPILVGCMLGEVARDSLVTSAGAQVGDDLILTKGIAIEGTAALALEAKGLLEARGISEELLERAGRYLFEPGLSVVKEALAACRAGVVHAMHDPTEGGLATGLWELAQASGVGLRVEEAAIPILPETAVLCQRLGLDPLGLLASGALILTAPPADRKALLSAFKTVGVESRVIGTVTPPEDGLRLAGPRGTRELMPFARDELARLLEENHG
jgi:hydrogenase maturation factor